MSHATIIFEGQAAEDVHLAPGITFDRRIDGVAFDHPPTGTRLFLPTDRPPLPGHKVTALASLQPLLTRPLAGRRELGGGAVRAAVAVAQRIRTEHANAVVHLLTSGPSTPELAGACDRDGVGCAALGRQPAPCNLILPGPNRTIIKAPVEAAPPLLDAVHRDTVLRLGDHAGVVACVSGKDAALTTAAVAAGNGARRVFQPTGSLPPELSAIVPRCS